MIIICVVFTFAVIGGIIGEFDKRKPTSADMAVAPTPTPVATPLEMPTSSSEKLSKAKPLVKSESSSSLSEGIELLQAIPKDAKEHKEAQSLLKTSQASLARLKSIEAKLGPKPENSAYDGSVRCVDRYLSRVLNDYHDSEYLEWSPVIRMDVKGEPYWAVRLKLRAKNAFGAKIVKDVIFFIQQDQVVKAVNL